MIDFARINSAAMPVLESLLCEWFPAGKRIGGEFCIGDLTGKPGSSLGVNLRTGRWQDFAGDAKGGDPIALLAAIRGVKQHVAAKELDERLNAGGFTHLAERGVKQYTGKPDEWVAQSFAPAGENPKPYHWQYGKPSVTWNYFTRSGALAGVVCRFDLPDGKQVLPYTWCRNSEDGRCGFRWKAMARPRCLYNLRHVLETRCAVMIVEGEKTTDAAQELLPCLAVTTWSGGGKAIHLTNWTWIVGRDVVIWPDADEAGLITANKIRLHLPNASIGIVQPPEGVTEGWDLADGLKSGWTTKDVMNHLVNAKRIRKKKCHPSTR